MCECNICCFMYSRFRTICGQEMQVVVLWLRHACYHVTRPPAWHLTLTRLGQIPVTRGFQTTRTSSVTCPSTIFSLTLFSPGLPTDTHLKQSQSLKGGPPVSPFWEWRRRSTPPIFHGPCNIQYSFIFSSNSRVKRSYFSYLKDTTISCCVWMG